MASIMDMSLEDIIQRNRFHRGAPKPNKSKWVSPKTKAPIIDARNKIISKKRAQITDAREKLSELAKQKDARIRLQHLRNTRALNPAQQTDIFLPRSRLMRAIPLQHMERAFIDTSRQQVSQPPPHSRFSARQQMNTKRFLENRAINIRSFDKMPKMKPIVRTVENDLDISDDPMEEDDVLPKTSSQNHKANLQLRITHNNDKREIKSSHRLSTPEKSPPRPPSILKKRPIAALKTESKTEKPAMECRIIVSNLRNTVTAGDIQELFGDVGHMLESRLVRPGTAEVIYKSVKDAQEAVDLYHNRQLDGQPMNCLLVTPRSTAAPARNASRSALYSSNSNVELDISTFHKVLFSNM